jgi:NADH-quinone oxidoreductase subunit H
MTDIITNLYWILIPGFLLTIGIGIIATWLVRKVSALVHHRIGPPLPQTLYDVVKLMGKETLIPEAAQKAVFVAAPLIGFSAILLLSTMLWKITISPETPFVGDVIVAIYLLVIPSLALILGGSASASPHASIGTAREMKLVVSYELPLLLALIIVIIKAAPNIAAGQTLSIAAIAQNTHFSISGLLAFLAALLCVQAKLGFTPFDIAEAETELAGGVLIEYSGALLAVWKLMQTMMVVALPWFVALVFMGGFCDTTGSVIWGIAAYVIVLVLLILIKNTNPRMRIDQAMKFFWFYCSPVLVVAVILAIIGNYCNISWL